jgi:8-oxo-dGTP diphosphatase
MKEFGEKTEGIQYKERKAVYALIVNENDEIAVIKTERGYFLPGGGLEKNETIKKCLHRELLEETGYSIEIKKFIGTAAIYEFSPKLKEYLKGIGYFYKVNLIKKISEPIENDHYLVWLKKEEAINSMLLEHQNWAIKELDNK